MRIKSIRRVDLDTPEPVYDIVSARPNNNFLVKVGDKFLPIHNCGILDEVDFVGGASAQMEKSKVMGMYRSVKRRMESRYAKNGELPGILFLVSSKKSEHDFLEQYAKTQKDNPNILIVDEPLWVVKPDDGYSGKTFSIAIGNNYVKSRIITNKDNKEALQKQGFRIIDVPVEHRQAFELDIDAALMDIAGISVASASKFIGYDRLRMNYTERINPFQNEVLTIGLDDNLEIKDFFVPDLVSDEVRSQPGFIHIDASLTGDHTGISLVTIEGTKEVKKYVRAEEARIEDAIDLVYRQVFTVGIQAPANSEISLEKTRQFIYYLKSIGFNIQGVSMDGYQSADTLQQLKVAGYKTKLVSLDKSPAGYLTFRSAINEERLDLLDLSTTMVEHELLELEQDGISGKIDHPIDGCITADTKIRLADNTVRSVQYLMDHSDESNYVYSINEQTLKVERQRIRRVFFTKRTNKLCKVILSNDKIINCTPDHRFMLRDGTYKEAQDLNPRDNLMTLFGTYIVVSNMIIDESADVYDIEVENNHNFLLEAGVFIHNSKDEADSLCGAMYNASMSGISTTYRHASEDASITAELMSEDLEAIDEMNSMLGLGNVKSFDPNHIAEEISDNFYDDLVF